MLTAAILVLVAVGFTVAEVFFPSLGAFGIIAATCILIADMIAFRSGVTVGWIFIGIEVVLVPLTVVGAFRVLPRTRFGARMVLSGPVTPAAPGAPDLSPLVGRSGKALTPLRPAGTVEIDGQRVSVVGLGGMIDRGASVVVIGVEGTEVRVRVVSEQSAHPS